MINCHDTLIISLLLFLYISQVKVLSSALHAQTFPILILRNQVSDPFKTVILNKLNPLNAELNPICHLLALLGVHFLHVSRIRDKSLTLRLLMSYIYIYKWSTHS